MEFAAVLVVAGVVFAYSLVSNWLAARSITGPIVFVATGMALGPAGAGAIGGDLTEGSVEILAEVTLVLLLFTDATRIDLALLRRQILLPSRLLLIGLPLTVLAGTGAAVALFPDLALWEAALVAAVLAPTDAALGQAVVSDLRVPVRIRQALNVESGLNDGLMLPAITVVVALAAIGIETESPSFWFTFAARQIAYGLVAGVVIGLAGGRLLDASASRGWVAPTMRQLATLSVGMAAFAAATALDGNGFVAAFVAGLSFGSAAREQCESAADFAEDEGHLLMLITFLFFGATLAGPALSELTPRIAIYAVLSLTLLRMVPVGLSVIGVGLKRNTIGYLGWFGPRGLASILFGIFVLEQADLPSAEQILHIVTWTVLISVVLHGISSVPLTDRYTRWFSSMDDADAEAVDVDAMRTRAMVGAPGLPRPKHDR